MPGFDHFQKELSRVIFQKMKAPGETISYPETFPLLKQHLLLIFCWSGGQPDLPGAISPASGVSGPAEGGEEGGGEMERSSLPPDEGWAGRGPLPAPGDTGTSPW